MRLVGTFPIIDRKKILMNPWFILSLVVVVLAFVAIVVLILRLTRGVGMSKKEGRIKITNLNKKNNKLLSKMISKLNDDKEIELEEEKPADKTLFVVDFKGDVHANQVESLKEEISAIIQVANEGDEVLVKLESPGGVVHGYGLAAAQLNRLKEHKIKLTVSVDKVAASGGYMMAVVADTIVAAPFAVIGSIGVVMEFPNFAKLLKRVGVEYLQLTAGKHKRSISVFTENSEEGLEKTKQDLGRTHDLFKSHVKKFRPQLNLDTVATGDVWYGSECVENKLIDEVKVSDDVILEKMDDFKVFSIEYKPPQTKSGLLSSLVVKTANAVIGHWVDKAFASQITGKR
jgi:serine protease SohB